MSNYTKQINWSGKDALADSDPNKVISGDDFDTEFTAVQTAINSKADLNGSATEAFSCTTATAGTNTTQAATTAFVATAVGNITASFINNLVYPVGSIYASVDSTNPATTLGAGTWVRFAEGRTLVGVDSAQTEFDTVEETGGAKAHTLTESEMPSHTHQSGRGIQGGDLGNNNIFANNQSGTNVVTTTATGGNQPHNNLQPYVTVYYWKRTA